MSLIYLLTTPIVLLVSKDELISDLYKNKYEWLLQVSKNLTNNYADAEDLVSDLFVRLSEYKDINKLIFLGRELNLFYIFKMLKSQHINNVKRKKQTFEPWNDSLEHVPDEQYDLSKDQDWEHQYATTMAVINDMNWFDSKLLQTYISEDHSIASLSQATNISKSTIFTSLKKSKLFIKQEVYVRTGSSSSS